MTCYYCEEPYEQDLFKTSDHIIPKSKDGNNLPINMVDACNQCNHLKGNLLPEEFSNFLKTRIIAIEKGITNALKKGFTLDRLRTCLDNNERLIIQISTYRHKLYKTLPEIATPAAKKPNFKIHSKLGFFDNPVILTRAIEQKKLVESANQIDNTWLENYQNEQACNFHY